MVAHTIDTRPPLSAPGPAPDALVDPDGRPRFGVYDSPFRRVGLAAARWTTRWGFDAPAPFRASRLKRWQHFTILHPEALLTCAIVDAAYLKTTWVQFVDLAGGLRVEHHHQTPRADCRIADALWDDRTYFRRRGYHLAIRNHLDAGRHTLTFDIAKGAAQGLPQITGELRALHPLGPGGVQPLVVALPLEDDRCLYSHKVPLPLEGQLSVGRRCLRFDPERCSVILDVHGAHYPYHTWWRWGTFAGRDEGGRRIGLNLTRNIVIGDALNENALWVDGRLERLDSALFEREGAGWRVGTRDSRVELMFEPMGSRSEDLNLGLVRSRFKQFYGRYSGRVRYGDEDLRVDAAYGLLEDHDSKW